MYTYVSNGIKRTVYQEQDVRSNAYDEKWIKKAIQDYKDNKHNDEDVTCRLALKIIHMLGCHAQGDCAAIRYMDAGMVTNWPEIMKEIMDIYNDEVKKNDVPRPSDNQHQNLYMLQCDYWTYIKPMNDKIQQRNALVSETLNNTGLPADITTTISGF
jgi:hypothetical protein